ncbi:MAG: tyrosine--tRNA ligase [Omnitrophica WOR_2 bacterium RIFCSPHIGHO2_01_FULL_48_9]|nr:MAG: tyrosine--tRNA ligase [Omnitrophica WOR_2 bacterium RIFCSPHIGHO2_02_FULL_48_11]OGX32497.1 MAG: tyrosine--tRNA ligase [Omnitrophica WOR_2 bacterium RIFCSPHIGHO2_01_FULL_48_9]
MQIQDSIAKIIRGTAEIINREALEEKLIESEKRKKPLCIKAGFDPTAPDIHLGHYVLLKKLRQFQDLGHQVYFLIGDFTAQVGDPSGRDQTRPKMDAKQIAQNAKTYKAQVFKILDPKKTKVVFNSAWLEKLSAQEILELCAHSTVAQMLVRADFKKRFEDKREISLLEFIYPLLQGYDSVHLKADVELGGSDQKFNLLMGRQLQEAFGFKPQVVIMTPLLEGTDGVQKMSKSLGNYIGINEPPREIFGKVMSISDALMLRYYELLTDCDLAEIKTLHPREAKLRLGCEIVKQFYGAAAAQAERENFEKTFSQKKVPDDIEAYRLGTESPESLVDILVRTKLVESKNEARRLIGQAAITHDGNKITAETWAVKPGVLKVGKRRFLRLVE